MNISKNIKLELEREADRAINLYYQAEGLKDKLTRLEAEIEKLEQATQNSFTRIAALGSKGPRRDGKPETPEETQKRKDYNEEYMKMKMLAIKQVLQTASPNAWSYLQKYLPEIYRDSDL